MDELRRRARHPRNNATDAERHLWQHLRNHLLAGHRFRRQMPLAGYIADFACPALKPVIELDGGQHTEHAAYDARRTEMLQAHGYRVLRYWNDDALVRTAAVLEDILRAIEQINCPPPQPSPALRAREGVRPLPFAEGEGGGLGRGSFNPAGHQQRMKILVTGGGGFLGQALCRGLVERGHEVLSFNRGHYPALAALGVGQIRGDLADVNAVHHAAAGVDAVFHNAAKAGAWGSYDSYFDANVAGTRNVLEACRAHDVGKLVYTSTPSVTHRATHPVEGLGADEVPYGEDFQAPYAATKAIAEQEVLAANGPQLATVALRPRLIWGPGDQQLVPRLAERARQGRLRFVGDGLNKVDTTYIDNAAQAHFDAFEHLAPGAACAGKAYFISNGEPLPMRELLNKLLAAVGAPAVEKSISFKAAYRIGAVCEKTWPLLRLRGEPPMTRFLAEQLCTPHWYSMEPARRDFGYVPRVSIAEGLRRLAAAC